MADDFAPNGDVSFSAIILAGHQTTRIPTVRYKSKDAPIRIYINVCDSLNLREFTINVFPERQQISAEFAMTGMQEIEARKNDFSATREAIERIKVAKVDAPSDEEKDLQEGAAIEVDDVPRVSGATSSPVAHHKDIRDEGSRPKIPQRSLRSHMKKRAILRPEVDSASSVAPIKKIAAAKSEPIPSRVSRSKHTPEPITAATAMSQAPHRVFSTTMDRSTRSPNSKKELKSTKAGLDAATRVLRNGKITGLRPTMSKRQCLRTRHEPSEPESIMNKITEIRAGGKGETGKPNIGRKPSSLASHRPKRVCERGWT